MAIYVFEVRPVAKEVSAANAKSQLAALASEVAFGGQRIVVQRRGKPWVGIVSVDDLEYLERHRSLSARPLGALAMVGAWNEVADEVVDSLVKEIYDNRESDTGRPVEFDC